MKQKPRKIFIGLAWPYANGSLHLGHASAFVGADILARYHRLIGDDVLFVSGSDCYGTPIALEALEKDIEPATIANKYHEEFVDNLITGLSFSYDNFTKTTNPIHKRVVQDLFLKIYNKGYLYKKTEKALYSPHLERFLPDRFVEGVCPHCKFDSARGDQCDNCGKLLDPLELVNPHINKKIIGSNKMPAGILLLEERESEHFYLKLSKLNDALTDWVNNTSNAWRLNASRFTKAFLEQGLKDRAITRDTTWGVPIPLEGYAGKSIYVWFEAVTGYLSASIEWAEKIGKPEQWNDWWKNENAKHYYVHGKDNIPFHTIIWPAILLAEGTLNLPNQIVSSEYLNLEGKQFSKSRGWAVWLPQFLEKFDGETLRYFLIANGPENNDINFTWQEFQNKVNGELIGTYANFVNRVVAFSANNFPEGVSIFEEVEAKMQTIFTSVENAFLSVGECIEIGEFRKAYKTVLEIIEECNRHISNVAPWKLIKEAEKSEVVEQYIACYLHIIENVAVLFYPFTPKSSEKICAMLNSSISEWKYQLLKKEYQISTTSPLYNKIEDADIEEQEEKLKIVI